jgi:calcineurin-like phosphoesterase family protein
MKLTAQDQLWVLGDISSGRPEEEKMALALLSEVPASLELIAGNHDGASSIHRDGYKKQREWLRVFNSIQQFGRIRIGGRQVLMSHYPYSRSGDGNRSSSRYHEYRLQDMGLPLIHGHTHHDDVHLDGDMSQFCVSWDARRRLIGEGEISAWIEGYSPVLDTQS